MDNTSPDDLVIISSVVFLITLISMLGICLCCKRKQNPKSELLGLEGIVKLKHLEDSNLNVSIFADSIPLHTYINTFIFFRSANAPHRSLPDIPVVEAVCDNNSELYATVGDKLQEKPLGKSPTNTKKMSNISQHSSLSQADDVSSPYARVRSPAHAYDKLKKAEHPYAQVQPGTNGGVAQVVVENDEDDENAMEDPIQHNRESNQSLMGSVDIPAASAIAGRISASQDMPYMTPPIVQPSLQQHFSGDSQDSSKGYTSISVREPLANIIAQTNQQNAQRRRREVHDSHYATVSDDSDEMYAAIEDPNNPGSELYTSGSETYAQIQPTPITIAVEINNTAPYHPPPPPVSFSSQSIPTLPQSSLTRFPNRPSSSTHIHPAIEETVVNTAENKINFHSRQASSSSCTSSVGNIGSPKPEKRSANSPLPPTPKGQHQSRNSTSSILEYHEGAPGFVKAKADTNNNKMKQSPSKDLEGMYAKVMKKSNKLSNLPSENSSPVLARKVITIETTTTTTASLSKADEVDSVASDVIVPSKSNGNDYETIDKKRSRNGKAIVIDAGGYETIPADRNNNINGIKEMMENVTNYQTMPNTIPDYAQITDKTTRTVSKAKVSLFTEQGYECIPNAQEEQLESLNDPKYETLKLDKKPGLRGGAEGNATDSDNDPNYEMVLKQTSSSSSSTLIDDGYSHIANKSATINVQKSKDSNARYSKVKNDDDNNDDDDDDVDDNEEEEDNIPGYSCIKEKKDVPLSSISIDCDIDCDSNIYSSIPPIILPIGEKKTTTPSTDSNSSELPLDYEPCRTSNSITPTTLNNSNYESLSNSESTFEDSTKNPYERLHNSISPDPVVLPTNKAASSNNVDDFYEV
ncbi:unnamed protein product [Diamesa serratosioi]